MIRLAALAAALALAGCQPAAVPTPARKPAPASSSPAPAADPRPTVGDAVTIQAASGRMIVSADRAAFDESSRLSARKDATGLAAMELNGRLWICDNGTRAVLLKWGGLACQIRITDGPHAGKEGWIEPEFLKRAP